MQKHFMKMENQFLKLTTIYRSSTSAWRVEFSALDLRNDTTGVTPIDNAATHKHYKNSRAFFLLAK